MTEPIANELPPQVRETVAELRTTPPNTIQNALQETTKEIETPPKWFTKTADKILNAWFDPKSYESEEMYEKVGIKTFKKYIPTTGDLVNKYFWKKIDPGDFVNKGESSLKNFETFTRVCETIHLSFFALMAGEAAVELATGNASAAAFTTGINILVNAYPIMLQRYNRIRLFRAINKFEDRAQSTEEPVK